MKTKILPFTNDMIPEAGRLLADRHARNRTQFPFLPPRFEDPQVAAKAVETLWKAKYKGGYASFRDDKMIAYVIGEGTTQAWGRSGYVYLPGYAVASDESPALFQDMYARLGDDWIQKGCFNHYLYISAADVDLIDALFDLDFGKERVDALLDLRSVHIPDVEAPNGITIRKAMSGDNAITGSFSNIIYRALARAPYWHPTIPEDRNELHEGWSELADENDWTVWLALEEDEALGMIGFCPEEEQDTQLLASPRTIYLSVAATKPQARGRGINTALAWHGLRCAHQDGFEICYTNWISPNLLASRFWPRFGFTDVAYRVAKQVSPMIAWAKDE
jgi:GNAT superfamily N-acetyltransferase